MPELCDSFIQYIYSDELKIVLASQRGISFMSITQLRRWFTLLQILVTRQVTRPRSESQRTADSRSVASVFPVTPDPARLSARPGTIVKGVAPPGPVQPSVRPPLVLPQPRGAPAALPAVPPSRCARFLTAAQGFCVLRSASHHSRRHRP